MSTHFIFNHHPTQSRFCCFISGMKTDTPSSSNLVIASSRSFYKSLAFFGFYPPTKVLLSYIPVYAFFILSFTNEYLVGEFAVL